jgi:hypothetical protein
MKNVFCFLSGFGFQEIFIVLFVIGFFFGIFLAIRAIMLWYWKINTIVDNQQMQIRLLQDLLSAFNRNNASKVD